jgi:adenylylsulfate kinase
VKISETAHKQAVLWFTGLSGSGKSTLADAVGRRLTALGILTHSLDGDALRRTLAIGFSRHDRESHILRVGTIASDLERQGVTTVCALISPYTACRAAVRAQCATFIEVYVCTPLCVCERRDPKGLYAKARRGEILHFTGIDDPYEAPGSPELAIDTSHMAVEEASAQVLQAWHRITRVDAKREHAFESCDRGPCSSTAGAGRV